MGKGELEAIIEDLKTIIHGAKGKMVIDPVWVAERAVERMDPDKRSPIKIKIAAIFEFRQLARGLLRKYFEPDATTEPEAEHSLFPELQWRYPQAKGEEGGYVLLERMTPDDVSLNVARLRKTGYGMLAHADRLEKWAEEHIREVA